MYKVFDEKRAPRHIVRKESFFVGKQETLAIEKSILS
jgi:hypothetical protein